MFFVVFFNNFLLIKCNIVSYYLKCYKNVFIKAYVIAICNNVCVVRANN
jgi:hypothetical protein